MDKKIDLIINSNFIQSQQTHRKKSYIIWISKRPLYWESNEREEAIQPLTRTQRSTKNYSRIIGEAPMEVVNPSMMVSRLDLVVLDFAPAGIDFRRLP